MKLYTIIYIVIITIISSCITDSPDEENGSKLAAGDRMPNFSVIMNDGHVISSDDIVDKIAVIIFFNTECKDCRFELPELQQAYEATANHSEWIAIAREEESNSIADYWRKEGLTIPYSPQSDRSIYSLFATSGIPRIYISSEQTILYSFNPHDRLSAGEIITIIDILRR